MGKRYSLEELSEIERRGVFFDANVLIYLYWATANNQFEEIYAQAFKKLLKNGNKLYTDYLVIAEFVNRALRSEFEKHKISKNTQNLKFKIYRNSEDGKRALSDIYTIVLGILNKFIVIGKLYEKNDLLDFLKVDELDFNDKAIYSLCKENSLVLLTNDSDFKSVEITILTGNKKLLN